MGAPLDELKKELMGALLRGGGSTYKACVFADCSHSTFWRLLTKAGMREEPERVRRWLEQKFRLPPLQKDAESDGTLHNSE